MNFTAEDLKDPNLFRYLYANKKFEPGKSTVFYSAPFYDEKEINAALDALIHGKWLSDGEHVHHFECEFSKMFGFKGGSVMVNSGSSANLILITTLKKFYQWEDGDEIIISSIGFPTTLSPIIQNNLKPVFVDISMDDLNWNVYLIESLITEKTRALFYSPALGNSCNLDKLVDICHRRDLKLIVDNCDSLGSKWKGQWLTAPPCVGASCSFYASHHISCLSSGGMVSFHEEELTKLARSLAGWASGCYCVGTARMLPNGTCKKRFSNWLSPRYEGIVDHKYCYNDIGYNFKVPDILGAVGSEQLKKFDEIKTKRRLHHEIVGSFLEEVPGVRIVRELQEAESSWFAIPIVCETPRLKRKLVEHLENAKIQTRNVFSGNFLIHEAFKDYGNYLEYENANKVLDLAFFIGCPPYWTDEILDYIKETIRVFKVEKELRMV